MRIISGTHKGRRLQAPKNLPVRPTTDNAKEALFNILNNSYYFNELKVLDLFAGTGNISFEFASRGTPSILCVDAHFGCIKFIHKTAQELKMPIRTIKKDVFSYLLSTSEAFDIIFADPPYHFEVDQFELIVQTVFDRSLLKLEGVLIIEHPKQTDLSQTENYSESRRYGGSVFSFFRVSEG